MRYFIALTAAAALAALSSVVCGYFDNDAAKGISTGFSQGELRIIPWIVFTITLVSISKRGDAGETHGVEGQGGVNQPQF